METQHPILDKLQHSTLEQHTRIAGQLRQKIAQQATQRRRAPPSSRKANKGSAETTGSPAAVAPPQAATAAPSLSQTTSPLKKQIISTKDEEIQKDGAGQQQDQPPPPPPPAPEETQPFSQLKAMLGLETMIDLGSTEDEPFGQPNTRNHYLCYYVLHRHTSGLRKSVAHLCALRVVESIKKAKQFAQLVRKRLPDFPPVYFAPWGTWTPLCVSDERNARASLLHDEVVAPNVQMHLEHYEAQAQRMLDRRNADMRKALLPKLHDIPLDQDATASSTPPEKDHTDADKQVNSPPDVEDKSSDHDGDAHGDDGDDFEESESDLFEPLLPVELRDMSQHVLAVTLLEDRRQQQQQQPGGIVAEPLFRWYSVHPTEEAASQFIQAHWQSVPMHETLVMYMHKAVPVCPTTLQSNQIPQTHRNHLIQDIAKKGNEERAKQWREYEAEMKRRGFDIPSPGTKLSLNGGTAEDQGSVDNASSSNSTDEHNAEAPQDERDAQTRAAAWTAAALAEPDD